jgi:hypothetical protein
MNPALAQRLRAAQLRHGEIRWLDQGERVLGPVMVRPGGRTLATFPFEITPV